MNLSHLLYFAHRSKPRFEKQFFSHIKEPLTVFLLVLCLLGGGWPAWAGPAEKATPASTGAHPGFKPSARQAAQLAPLMVSASRFKSLARTDFEKALLVYTREDGREKLWDLDRELWDIELSQWAWMQFFGAAVPVLGGRQGRFDLVGYYNPYSDVFLITVWQPGRTIHQIVDAQMLMGDWVRTDTDELDLIPLWRRDPIHRPVALGLATARSLLAFEKAFASADRDNWRSRLPILKDEAALKQLNDPVMALMLNTQLVNVGEILAPDPDAKTLQACRDITTEVVKRAVDGKLEPMLFLMADTLPGTARDLKAIPPEWFGGLKTTGVLTASQGVMVFLSPTEQTTASLCLYFSTMGKRVDIRRIDLVDYRKFYSELKTDPSGLPGKEAGMNKRKPVLTGILPLICLWIFCMSSMVHADTYATIGPASNEQIVVERAGRQDSSTAYDTVAAGAELTSDVVNAGGPMYNAAESVGDEVKNSLFYLKKNSKKNNVRLLEKVGFKKETAKNIANNPVKSMSSFGKNMDKVTKSMDFLDKWGTGWQIAGALAGDDTTGAKEAVNNAILSGATAGGGAWLGAKAGAVYGAAGGPGGAAVGGIVGALGGAIAASYLYDTQVKTRLDKGAHKEVVKMLEEEERAEKQRRRIRVDIRTVYPNGVMISSENLLPPMEVIHQRAQEIREQRRQDRIEQATADLLDKCPLNPNKTKPGLCGCAVPETDSDGDFVPDCIDECPNDPKQYQAGPEGCSEKVIVPTVLGKPSDWAVRAIKAAGLVPAPGGGDPAPDKKSEFKIQSQNPVGGNRAEPGSPVSIRIYSAYNPVIPNVIGLKESEARGKITAIGMKPVISKNKVAPTDDLSGKVWAQSAPDGLFITLDVYKDLKEERCLDLRRRFWGAMADSKLTEGKEIISQARECDFYEKGLAKVKKMECLDNAVTFLNAMKGSNYSEARAILTANKHCDFHDEWAQKLTCQENLSEMTAALRANDLNRYRAVLVKSDQCGFYNQLAEAWNEGQKRGAEQRKQNEQWIKTLGQFVGSALQEMSSGSGSGTTSRGSNRGHASTTPVVKEGQCNDVRKAGANQPERHIIKLGSRGRTFVFDYETYNEEDRIIVSQGSRTLFDSGCVGTHGRKSVRLKKRFRSKVTVDVQPNCNGGTNTQWQFTVHCPQ